MTSAKTDTRGFRICCCRGCWSPGGAAADDGADEGADEGVADGVVEGGVVEGGVVEVGAVGLTRSLTPLPLSGGLFG